MSEATKSDSDRKLKSGTSLCAREVSRFVSDFRLELITRSLKSNYSTPLMAALLIFSANLTLFMRNIETVSFHSSIVYTKSLK